MTTQVLPRSGRGVCRGKRLTNLNSARRGERRSNAFTLIELIVVVGIIIILAGLVLSTAGYARKKSARARAETEIAAISAACESYKADNGVYPTNGDTNALDPVTNIDSSAPPAGQTNLYSLAGLYLYEKLLGVTSGSRSETPTSRTYFTFKPSMLYPAPPSTDDVVGLRDPFGNLYGYSTKKASDPSANGYNPTFDLWSTAGAAPSPLPSPPATQQNLWIKNW